MRERWRYGMVWYVWYVWWVRCAGVPVTVPCTTVPFLSSIVTVSPVRRIRKRTNFRDMPPDTQSAAVRGSLERPVHCSALSAATVRQVYQSAHCRQRCEWQCRAGCCNAQLTAATSAASGHYSNLDSDSAIAALHARTVFHLRGEVVRRQSQTQYEAQQAGVRRLKGSTLRTCEPNRD